MNFDQIKLELLSNQALSSKRLESLYQVYHDNSQGQFCDDVVIRLQFFCGVIYCLVILSKPDFNSVKDHFQPYISVFWLSSSYNRKSYDELCKFLNEFKSMLLADIDACPDGVKKDNLLELHTFSVDYLSKHLNVFLGHLVDKLDDSRGLVSGPYL